MILRSQRPERCVSANFTTRPLFVGIIKYLNLNVEVFYVASNRFWTNFKLSVEDWSFRAELLEWLVVLANYA